MHSILCLDVGTNCIEQQLEYGLYIRHWEYNHQGFLPTKAAIQQQEQFLGSSFDNNAVPYVLYRVRCRLNVCTYVVVAARLYFVH